MICFYSWLTFSIFLIIFMMIGIVCVNKENKKNQQTAISNNGRHQEGAEQKTEEKEDKKDNRCPSNFTYYKSEDSGVEFCYVYINKKHSYPPDCPYTNHLAHDYDTKLYELYKNKRIWIRAGRKFDSDQITPFAWKEPSRRYGEIIRNYQYNNNNNNDKDNLKKSLCMTIENGIYLATNCEEKHEALCVYTISEAKTSRYCNDRFKGKKCINSNLDLDSGKCYCFDKKFWNQSRNKFCNFDSVLAEPRQKYQTNLIITSNNLGKNNNNVCYFGLFRDGKQFKWSSDKKLIDYTYWTPDVDFDFYLNFGALKFNKNESNSGWILSKDKSLNCALCENSIKNKKLGISLTSSIFSEFVTVYIVNPTELTNYFGDNFALYCFSDFNTNGIIEKVVNFISNVPNDSNLYNLSFLARSSYPALYWCEGFSHPHMTHFVTETLITHVPNNLYKTYYVIVLNFIYSKNEDPIASNIHVRITDSIRELTKPTGILLEARPIRFNILESNQNGKHQLIIHLATRRNGYSYLKEKEIIEDAISNNGFDFVIRNGMFCLESWTKNSDGRIGLTWRQAFIGSTVIPEELCLEKNGHPVTRSCTGSYETGGEWKPVNGTCYENAFYPETLIRLHQLLKNKWNATRLDHDLLSVVGIITNATIIEVHIISELLETFTQNEKNEYNLTNVIEIISDLSEYDREVLKSTQSVLNSTDAILNVVDTLLTRETSENFGKTYVKTDNLIVQVDDLKFTRGLALYKIDNKYSNFKSSKTVALYENTDENALYDDNLQVAVYVPDVTFDKFKNNTVNSTKMVITFYSSHNLFNNENPEGISFGHDYVISVIIPEISDRSFPTTDSPILLIFNGMTYEDDVTYSCAYWNYGTNESMKNVKGSWKMHREPIRIENKSHLICYVDHLTHFGLLIIGSSSSSGNNSVSDLSTSDQLALQIITITGCVLSYFGLSAILLTALLFKRWRKQSGNAIIVNFSICLAVQMSLTLAAGSVEEDGLSCITSALSLHYFILAEFCWMLIISYLQYRKFVTVFQQPTSHLILKASIFGWIFPFVPVFLTLIVSEGEAYRKNSNGICYPVDDYYVFGVILPVGIVSIINLIVFFLIMKNVCSRKVKAYGAKVKDMKLQILLAFLLFFLLGMSWFFGLLAAIGAGIIFVYFFCLTATLQGFVMFVFFILMNENAKSLWFTFKKICIRKPFVSETSRKTSTNFSSSSAVSTISATLDDSKFK